MIDTNKYHEEYYLITYGQSRNRVQKRHDNTGMERAVAVTSFLGFVYTCIRAHKSSFLPLLRHRSVTYTKPICAYSTAFLQHERKIST